MHVDTFHSHLKSHLVIALCNKVANWESGPEKTSLNKLKDSIGALNSPRHGCGQGPTTVQERRSVRVQSVVGQACFGAANVH